MNATSDTSARDTVKKKRMFDYMTKAPTTRRMEALRIEYMKKKFAAAHRTEPYAACGIGTRGSHEDRV